MSRTSSVYSHGTVQTLFLGQLARPVSWSAEAVSRDVCLCEELRSCYVQVFSVQAEVLKSANYFNCSFYSSFVECVFLSENKALYCIHGTKSRIASFLFENH